MTIHRMNLLGFVLLAACGSDIDLSSPNGTASRAEAVFGQQWLTYGGGALMAHPKIRVVYWGSSGFSSYTQTSIPGYYSTLMASQWLTWLNDEYAINGQTIGAGQVASATTIAPWSTPTDVNTIGQELDRQMTLGYLAPPDADTLYLVHLPTQYESQWTYSDNTRGDSWSFVRQGVPVRYGVVPDSTANTYRIQLTASAILASLYTNPDRGRIDSWVNNYHEDQGVMCNGNGAQLWLPPGFPSAAELWSNANNQCVPMPLQNEVPDLSLTNSTNDISAGTILNFTNAAMRPVIVSAPAGVTVALGSSLAAGSYTTAHVTAAGNVHAASGQVVVMGVDPVSNVTKAYARFNVSVSGLFLSPQNSSVVRGASLSATLENNASYSISPSWNLPSGFSYSGPATLSPGTITPVSINTPANAAPGQYAFSATLSGGSLPGSITLTCPSGQTWCAGNSSCLSAGVTCPAVCGDGICNGGENCRSCALDCDSCPVLPTCTGGKVDCCGNGVCMPAATCHRITC